MPNSTIVKQEGSGKAYYFHACVVERLLSSDIGRVMDADIILNLFKLKCLTLYIYPKVMYYHAGFYLAGKHDQNVKEAIKVAEISPHVEFTALHRRLRAS